MLFYQGGASTKRTRWRIGKKEVYLPSHILKVILHYSFSGFLALVTRFRSINEQGMQQLRQSVIKPRIKPWMDTFPSHDINEETFSDYEANDPFIQTLIMNLDTLLVSFKESLTSANYETLVGMMAAEMTFQMEKTAFKFKFSRLGGLQFDREVRSLVSYFTSSSTWSMREHFLRLNQVATILNLESVGEIKDFEENWKITTSEIKQILHLRYLTKHDKNKWSVYVTRKILFQNRLCIRRYQEVEIVTRCYLYYQCYLSLKKSTHFIDLSFTNYQE